MNTQEIIVQIIVIVGFGLWAFSKVKRQSIRESIDDIKDFIAGVQEKYG